MKCNVRHFYYDWNRGILDNVTLETKTALVMITNMIIIVIVKMKIINIMTMCILIKTPLNMMMKRYLRKNSKLERNLDCIRSNRGSRKESKSAVKVLLMVQLPIGRFDLIHFHPHDKKI